MVCRGSEAGGECRTERGGRYGSIDKRGSFLRTGRCRPVSLASSRSVSTAPAFSTGLGGRLLLPHGASAAARYATVCTRERTADSGS